MVFQRFSALSTTIVLCLYLLVTSGDVKAQETKWSPWIDAEADAGKHRFIGQMDAFAPVWQNENSLLFINPRFRFDDQNSREYNLGLGFRHLFENRLMMGGHIFADRSLSSAGNYFNQGTLGLETVTANWKLRINDYEPFGTRKYQTAPQLIDIGNSVQIVNGSEKALRGNDFEMGHRLPFYDEASLRQMWVYGGGYMFSGQGVKNVNGPRARIEYEVGDIPIVNRSLRLRLSGEIQHDSVRDTQWHIGFRIGIPLGGSGSTEHMAGMGSMERHMQDPVQRDVDIITGASYTREDAINSYTNMPISGLRIVKSGDNVSGAVSTAGANSVVVVDGSQGAVNLSGSNTIVLNNGQTLIGGGSVLPVYGAKTGKYFSYRSAGSAPTISGSSLTSSHVIELADNSVVKGITVTSNDAGYKIIFGNGVKDFTVVNNNLSCLGGGGFDIDLEGGTSGLVNSNTLVSVDGNSRGIEVYNPSFVDNGKLTLSNNTISATNNISVTSEGIFIYGMRNAEITGNTISATNGYGIESIHNTLLTITGNTLNELDHGVAGIHSDTNVNALINSNVINDVGNNGILWGIWLDNVSANQVDNNTINGNITLGAVAFDNAIATGSGNAYSGTNACATYGSNSGSVSFVDSRHCP